MGGLSIWHWIIVLVVVLLVLRTTRLLTAGKDLGDADKVFKDCTRETDQPGGQLAEQRRAEPEDKPRRQPERDSFTH